MEEDEGFLLASAAGGDLGAFRLLVERHTGAVRRLARHLLAIDAEADDVAQEVMLRLWQSRDAIVTGPQGLKPWLARVTANLCTDRYRYGRHLVLAEKLPETAVPPEQDIELGRAELGRGVERALAGLPERQRLALTLFHYEGFTMAQTADVMEASEEAVESLLARARRTLKERLQGEWRQMVEETPWQEGTVRTGRKDDGHDIN